MDFLDTAYMTTMTTTAGMASACAALLHQAAATDNAPILGNIASVQGPLGSRAHLHVTAVPLPFDRECGTVLRHTALPLGVGASCWRGAFGTALLWRCTARLSSVHPVARAPLCPNSAMKALLLCAVVHWFVWCQSLGCVRVLWPVTPRYIWG